MWKGGGGDVLQRGGSGDVVRKGGGRDVVGMLCGGVGVEM